MTSGRRGADDRLRRILAVVPFVVAAGDPTLSEVRKRFGYKSVGELKEDLDLLLMCGVHPFTPGDYIEPQVTGGRVSMKLAQRFTRPLRLTPVEALGVVGSAVALAAVPGSDPQGPLARGLAKLAAVLGIDPDEVVDVELGGHDPEVLATVRRSSEELRTLEVDYYSFGRDQWSRRQLDPWEVYSRSGAWYVRGMCRRDQGEKLFRVDRMRDPAIMKTKFRRPRGKAHTPTYSPQPTDAVVTLELEPSARWVVEQYPHEAVTELDGDRARVTLRVSERPFLERLLLRLGPDARVVEGDQDVGREAARRVLARYKHR